MENSKMIHVGLSMKQYAYLWTADIYDTLVYMYMYSTDQTQHNTRVNPN